MRLAALLCLIIELAAARFTRISCSSNEFCIDIKKCPTYKEHTNVSFRNWPAQFKTMAKENMCNREVVNNKVVVSVCCPSVMNSRTCGIQGDDRISKGQVAKAFEFPWMVLLRDQSGKFICGGTLISRRYVLTAAHCTKYRSIVSVRLGENDINQVEDCIVLDGARECAPLPQDIAVERAINHPDHSDRRKKNDITLLRLKVLATLGDSVNTICLPDGTPKQRMLEPSSYIVSGWGMTENGTMFDVLRYAQIPPVKFEKCEASVRNLHAALRLDESQLCAGGVDQVDNCAGDSGGPLQYVSNHTSRFVQKGVVAFGLKSCGVISEPGVYTNVAHFISWIVNHVDE